MYKILAIEDEPPVLANIIEILEAEDFKAIGVENGRKGIKVAADVVPDLILCDVMMPELDGYDVLKALRENPLTARIPFIFLTALSDRKDLRQGMEMGADDYLTKPFSREELLAAIAIRLEKYASIREDYDIAQQKSQGLEKRMATMQQFLATKDELLKKLCEDLRDPVSNINMAIHMLAQAPSEKDRERYLHILQEECDREIALLNQVSNLQNFLTPENAKVLRQYNLIKGQDEKNSSY
ncbi:MAG: response regulator [Oscillatoria sp. SIO1A7]|nr:response regulator [Oscillatoria sp. SIO1A7]